MHRQRGFEDRPPILGVFSGLRRAEGGRENRWVAYSRRDSPPVGQGRMVVTLKPCAVCDQQEQGAASRFLGWVGLWWALGVGVCVDSSSEVPAQSCYAVDRPMGCPCVSGPIGVGISDNIHSSWRCVAPGGGCNSPANDDVCGGIMVWAHHQAGPTCPGGGKGVVVGAEELVLLVCSSEVVQKGRGQQLGSQQKSTHETLGVNRF